MYKHGTYGEQVASGNTRSAQSAGTIPVYIGTAPIHHTGNDFSGKINYPVLVKSFSEAKNALGYSDDWDKFTLCEAMYAHFRNGTKPIGPIILINVFDPSKLKEAGGQSSVPLTNGVGYIEQNLLLSTCAVAGKVAGVDFKVEYVDDKVKFTALTTIASPVTVTYTKVLPESVQATDVIGSVAVNGTKTGIYAIDYVYQMYNIIPNIIAAPKWSKNKAVYDILVEKCFNSNGKWGAITVADITTADVTTISQAIAYKTTNALNSERCKLCYPVAKLGGKMFHLSTLVAVVMQITDSEADDVPYISPSNKQIDISGVFTSDTTQLMLDFESANILNAKGITTALNYGGSFKIWGPHMANYDADDESILLEKTSDTSIRMGIYMLNEFQLRFLNKIDGPMNKRLVDHILDESRVWINGLVTDGKIVQASIIFDGSVNSVTDMAVGDFVFDVNVTNDPNTKSITFRIKQTTDGLETLFGGEQ